MQNDFATLGVSPDVDEAGLKEARKRLVKKYHPDRCGGDPNAASRLIEVNAAYDRVRKMREAYGWSKSTQKTESTRKPNQSGAGRSTSGSSSDKSSRTKGIWPEFNESHPFFGWGSAQDFDPDIARKAEEERELKAKLKRAEEERARRQAEARKAAEEARIAAERAAAERAEREARERQQNLISHSLAVTEPIRRMLEEHKREGERLHSFSAATHHPGGFAAGSAGFGFDPAGFFSAGHIPESVMICGKNVLVYLPDAPSCRQNDFLLMPDIEFPAEGPPRFSDRVLTLKFDAYQEVGGWAQLTCATNGIAGELNGRHIQVCQRAAYAQAG